MRFCGRALIVGFALASSAFAGNIALDAAAGGSATATCGGTGAQPCFLAGYGALNAIDGIVNTVWVAPGSSTPGVAPYEPYLEITLPAGYSTVDWVTVSGFGNAGKIINYVVYAGIDPTEGDYLAGTGLCATVGNCAELTPIIETGTGTGTYPAGAPWTSAQFTDSLTTTDYVFYVVTASQADQFGHTAATYDDAYASTIFVDDPYVPEPGTFGLLGAGLLALGFAWRSRK
jgi:hypothetical protein